MADSEVIRLLRSFKADLLRGEKAQMATMAQRWLGVERRLSGVMSALAYEMDGIKRDGGTVTPEMLMMQVRYRELLVQLTDEMEPYSAYVERTITDRQRQLGRAGIKHAEQALRTSGVDAGFNRLPIEAVENIVGFAADGSPLNSLLRASWPESAVGLTQELVNGVALGLNPRQVAKNMARGTERTLNRMMNIARTETLRVYRTANLDSYKASGVVDGYKRLAAHDSRTCFQCIALEGTTYQLDEMMPTHPSCRCTLIPIVIGVPEPKWLKGEDWLVEQSPETQRDILGKSRYYMWQNGDVTLNDLVDVVHNGVWGDTLHATPLRELTGGL